MFQFTTTTVLNSLDWKNGKELIKALDDKTVVVKGVGSFKPANVQAIYKAEPVDAEFAEIKVDLTKVTDAKKGDVLKLDLYMAPSQGQQSSLFANDLNYKGKPLSVEFQWNDTNTAKDLEKIINKYAIAVYYEKLFDVKADGNALTITATDEYLRFKKAEILKFTKDTPFGEYTPVEDVVSVEKEGKESFGTYSWLLHNLRLPTPEHTRWEAVGKEEAPIPGAKYTQYTIHYCVDRGILGTNAVGHQVRSLTTHVFYVLDSLVSDFESKITGLGDLTVASKAKKVQTEDAPKIVDFDPETKVKA